MQKSTDGLVIKEQKVGEADRLITILTRDRGLVRAFANGAYKLKHKNASSTQLLCYSKFLLYQSKSGYTVNEAEPLELFYGLRNHLEKLSLAQYFCELALMLVPEEAESEGILRLLLNALFYLSRGLRDDALIKGVYEMRLLSKLGYMPDLVMCEDCGVYEADTMHFFVNRAKLLCGSCFQPSHAQSAPLGKGALTALRHCVYADFSKVFSFTLPEEATGQFARAAQAYLLCNLDRAPKTLAFYESIL